MPRPRREAHPVGHREVCPCSIGYADGMGRRESKAALRRAVEAGDAERAGEILDADPSLVDAGNSHGNTPLAWAVGRGDVAIARLLLARGAGPDQRNDGGTSLMDRAAFGGHHEVGDLLEAQGLVPSPGHLAAFGRVEELRLVLATEPELVRCGRYTRRRSTLLHMAVQGGSLPAARLLLEAGADPEAPDKNQHTPLALTAQEPAGARVELARLLLAHGARLDGAAGFGGGTLLHEAVMRRDRTLCEVLIDAGSDPREVDCAGKTPLDRATKTLRHHLEAHLEARDAAASGTTISRSSRTAKER